MTNRREKEKPDLDVQLIYIGPNLPNGRLQQYSVFRGSVPTHLNDIREKQPEIDDLIVPIEDFSRLSTAAFTLGTPQHQAYQSLKLSGKGA